MRVCGYLQKEAEWMSERVREREHVVEVVVAQAGVYSRFLSR